MQMREYSALRKRERGIARYEERKKDFPGDEESDGEQKNGEHLRDMHAPLFVAHVCMYLQK